MALTGLTVAEYFRDEEGQDVLLFVDNIFRFTQVSIGGPLLAAFGLAATPSAQATCSSRAAAHGSSVVA